MLIFRQNENLPIIFSSILQNKNYRNLVCKNTSILIDSENGHFCQSHTIIIRIFLLTLAFWNFIFLAKSLKKLSVDLRFDDISRQNTTIPKKYYRKCRRSLEISTDAQSQRVHLNGFSWVCLYRRWRVNSPDVTNAISQAGSGH